MIVNVIVLYTQRALDYLSPSGLTIDDADIERLSPLGTDHIALTGRYRIALLESLRDRGAYREHGTDRRSRGKRSIQNDAGCV